MKFSVSPVQQRNADWEYNFFHLLIFIKMNRIIQHSPIHSLCVAVLSEKSQDEEKQS